MHRPQQSGDISPVSPVSVIGGDSLQIGQFTTLFDKYVCSFSEKEKVKEFRRYMAEKKITNFITKLYQFCNAAKKRGVYVEHVMQEFLCTYPGESDGEVNTLIAQRAQIRESNLQLEKDLPKYSMICSIVTTFFKEYALPSIETWQDAADGFGVPAPEEFDPNDPFPWPSKKAFIENLEALDQEAFESREALFDSIVALALMEQGEAGGGAEEGEGD